MADEGMLFAWDNVDTPAALTTWADANLDVSNATSTSSILDLEASWLTAVVSKLEIDVWILIE